MTRLIAIDCSTDTASVALLFDEMLFERRFEAGIRQSEHVLAGIESLMRETATVAQQIDGVAVAIGPGAFTGVRLAIAAAQGLALAWNRPVVPVSTLATLAAGIEGDPPNEIAVLALLDARMGEIYAGWFTRGRNSVTALLKETVSPANQLTHPPGVHDYTVAGNGFAAYEADVVAALGSPLAAHPQVMPSAGQVARLAARGWPAAAMSPDRIEAAYLRNKVALTSAERLAAEK